MWGALSNIVSGHMFVCPIAITNRRSATTTEPCLNVAWMDEVEIRSHHVETMVETIVSWHLQEESNHSLEFLRWSRSASSAFYPFWGEGY